MPVLTIDNRRTTYHDYGAGPAVILLHPGFVADGMLPLVGRPELDGYRQIAPHRRGYGGSDPADGPCGMVELAHDTIELMNALGIPRADLVGHSLGGCVALEVARQSPERVGRLVLMEPPLGFALSEASLGVLLATAGAAVPRFMGGDHEGAVATWLDGAFGPGWQEPLERAVPGAVAQATRDAPAAFGMEVPALQSWQFGPAELAAVGAPTLSIVHEDVWPGFTEVHQALAANGAQVAVLPLRSHLLQILDPAAVADSIAGFLRTSSGEGVKTSPQTV